MHTLCIRSSLHTLHHVDAITAQSVSSFLIWLNPLVAVSLLSHCIPLCYKRRTGDSSISSNDNLTVAYFNAPTLLEIVTPRLHSPSQFPNCCEISSLVTRLRSLSCELYQTYYTWQLVGWKILTEYWTPTGADYSAPLFSRHFCISEHQDKSQPSVLCRATLNNIWLCYGSVVRRSRPRQGLLNCTISCWGSRLKTSAQEEQTHDSSRASASASVRHWRHETQHGRVRFT